MTDAIPTHVVVDNWDALTAGVWFVAAGCFAIALSIVLKR